MSRLFIGVLFLVYFVSLSYWAHSQVTNKGKDFWVSFERHYNASNLDASVMVIYISSESNATGEVIVHSTIKNKIPFTVQANSSTQITFEHNRLSPALSIMGQLPPTIPDISKRGIQIKSDVDIAVFVQIFQQYANDATTIFPTESLGTKYVISKLS